MKSGFVTIVGRPSSGKSTLMNKICGYKISIVAPSPQTTRNKVRGIVSDTRGQLVFIDTPGFHSSERTLNRHLRDLVVSSFEDIDVVLYVLDVTRKPGEEEERIFDIVLKRKEMVLAALNKIDIAETSTNTHRTFLEAHLESSRIYTISAVTGAGIPELHSAMLDLAPVGEAFYPDDYYTDQDPEFRVSEIIREKAINRVKEELPHALYVEIADMETTDGGSGLWIRAFLNVEKTSQQGILVGKSGAMIREIRREAQRELAQIFPYRIHLDLRVKVSTKWRKKDPLLKKIIF